MRRGSSTVVALTGQAGTELLSRIGRSSNVATVEPRSEGFEAAVAAHSEAAGKLAAYVVVRADPLEAVADEWRAMWDLSAGRSAFEERAGEAIAAWRVGRFELPDYYIVVAEETPSAGAPHPEDFHLGVLRSERPSRVIAVPADGDEDKAARVLRALAALPQGPWWPPLDRLVEAARSFFPGRLAG